MVPPPDRALYLAACSGDRSAFEQLVRRHHGFVHRRALGVMPSPSDAEDVAHYVWLRVSKHVRDVCAGSREPLDLEHEFSFMKWLSSVTYNLAIDALRRSKRQVWDPIEDHDPSYFPNPTERLESEQQRKAVRAAFKKVSETCQELLLLLIQDPPPAYEEIAAIIGRPVGSIGPTRKRCIEQLRAAMGMGI